MNGQSVVKALIALPGGAAAVYTSSGLSRYRHPDWLGSSRIASTPSRTLYYDGAYAPFGEAIAETGTTDRSFTGQDQDLSPNLCDFLFREYRAAHGRWIWPDPAGMAATNTLNPQSWNRYAYVGNQPVHLTDPMGLNASFCSAEFSYEDCGGDALFWAGGGGMGGWVFGGDYARAQQQGYVPGMPTPMWQHISRGRKRAFGSERLRRYNGDQGVSRMDDGAGGCRCAAMSPLEKTGGRPGHYIRTV